MLLTKYVFADPYYIYISTWRLIIYSKITHIQIKQDSSCTQFYLVDCSSFIIYGGGGGALLLKNYALLNNHYSLISWNFLLMAIPKTVRAFFMLNSRKYNLHASLYCITETLKAAWFEAAAMSLFQISEIFE